MSNPGFTAASIGVVGMSCRLPGADSAAEFWRLISENTDAVTEVPPARFDVSAHCAEPPVPGKTNSRFGGFLRDIRGFDAGFFRISPREANLMDPQQRLLLHVVWEALEDAGIPPATLAGSNTGVFVGQATADYAAVTGADAGSDVLGMSGSVLRAVTAGRVSHAFDFRGPSLVVDTACSSSLVAVHQARQSLVTGESDVAIVAGTNVVLSPADAISYAQGGMLSADGRCKFGADKADGFVRSEGIVAMVLKRTGDARRDGDRVRAALAGSAVTNDGDGDGLMLKPAKAGQSAALRAACRTAGVTPADLDYVEAHGTGTDAGDGVELAALAEARAGAEVPLRIGSVKTNVGHTEAAAGITGLAKAVLIAEHGLIPASLHADPAAVRARQPALELVAENQPLNPRGERALVGVSSFGISGTNAHVVVAGVPAEEPPVAETSGPQLLVLSAKSEKSLRALASAYAGFLGDAGKRYPPAAICHAAAVGRDALEHRLWAVGETHDELAAQLRACARDEPTPGAGTHRAVRSPRIGFVFPGQGGQWAGMGRRLLDTAPEFRAAMRRCDDAVRAELGWSVLDRLCDTRSGDLSRVEVAQPLLWAYEAALADLLRARGIEPDLCLGHSMGEAAAAYTSGALSLAGSAAVICRRSRLMTQVSGAGRMLAVELPADAAAELTADEQEVCVAAENAPRATVLSGEAAAIERVAARFDDRGVFARPVQVDVASHSPLMDELLPDLRGALDDVEPAPAMETTLLSTVRARPVDSAELTAGYWADNLRAPVRLASAVTGLAADEPCVLVELSPHPVLLGALRDCLGEHPASTAVATLSRREPEDRALLKAVGAVFAAGGAVDWTRFHRGPRPHVPLPHYPWDTTEHWAAGPARRESAEHRTVTLGELGLLDACRATEVDGARPVPAVAYLAAVWHVTGASAVRGLRFEGDLRSCVDGDVTVAAQRAAPGFTLTATGPDGAGCRVTGSVAGGVTVPADGGLDAALDACPDFRSGDRFERLAERRGYRFTAGSGVRRLWRGDGVVVAQHEAAPGGRFGVFEAALRTMLAIWPEASASYAMTGVDEVAAAEPPEGEFWTVARFGDRSELLVAHPDGRVAGALRGVEFVPVTKVAAPAGDVGEVFVRSVAQVLGTTPAAVDLHRSLRDLGLDSIMATQLRRALSAATDHPVTAADLLEPVSADRLLARLTAEREHRSAA
ncbi:type I polyketide synthase [Amycolatopsis sp.]|uniref:type I polyketide synthase n=1 Tax=Amycolatopsis sp. TaxID=37632 RepID=UPI002D802C32|nr:beta-ketoacyl synthase N-terminal-like domain-containing protein [Amycolatopsis sp.]HET6708104.1 beta-ketoacyl synthase N-terminal-like domain-containing protein [Amycolatopsis sp.]